MHEFTTTLLHLNHWFTCKWQVYNMLSEYKAKASLGPLNLGQLITVKTDQPVKIEQIVNQLTTLLENSEH